MGNDVGENEDWPPWPEEEYARYLEAERRRYAWVMRTYGGMTGAEADEAAEQWYDYEPPDKPYRGLVFHDEAWHWAMTAIKGDHYWAGDPGLTEPPQEYLSLE
ncbi:hypothetical protein ABIA35_004946 [Catenulispora sp. MAP12-49]|uniref:hypothetical protein n=1 Tax=Catenulispora sp. MAP12-49 TaxID=3156302 RepID=UPI003514BEC3